MYDVIAIITPDNITEKIKRGIQGIQVKKSPIIPKQRRTMATITPIIGKNRSEKRSPNKSPKRAFDKTDV